MIWQDLIVSVHSIAAIFVLLSDSQWRYFSELLSHSVCMQFVLKLLAKSNHIALTCVILVSHGQTHGHIPISVLVGRLVSVIVNCNLYQSFFHGSLYLSDVCVSFWMM